MTKSNKQQLLKKHFELVEDMDENLKEYLRNNPYQKVIDSKGRLKYIKIDPITFKAEILDHNPLRKK